MSVCVGREWECVLMDVCVIVYVCWCTCGVSGF